MPMTIKSLCPPSCLCLEYCYIIHISVFELEMWTECNEVNIALPLLHVCLIPKNFDMKELFGIESLSSRHNLRFEKLEETDQLCANEMNYVHSDKLI